MDCSIKRKSGRAVLIDNDSVILMYRNRLKDNKLIEYYGIPGGGIEKGESSKEATIREIKEELGLNIEIKEFLGMVEDKHNIGYVYSTNILGGNLKLGGEELDQNNPNNYYEIRKIKISELDKYNILEENKNLIRKAYDK